MNDAKKKKFSGFQVSGCLERSVRDLTLHTSGALMELFFQLIRVHAGRKK